MNPQPNPEQADLSIERFMAVETARLVDWNTSNLRTQSEILAGQIGGKPAEGFEVIMTPESGAPVDPEEVMDALHAAWHGSDKVRIEDGPMITDYWQVADEKTEATWTVVEEHRLTSDKKGGVKPQLLAANVKATPPKEYQDALANLSGQEKREHSPQAHKGPGLLGKLAARASLLSNTPSAAFRAIDTVGYGLAQDASRTNRVKRNRDK